nr:MAG TPA: hypothetical protein [Caudoviricetes sp.]
MKNIRRFSPFSLGDQYSELISKGASWALLRSGICPSNASAFGINAVALLVTFASSIIEYVLVELLFKDYCIVRIFSAILVIYHANVYPVARVFGVALHAAVVVAAADTRSVFRVEIDRSRQTSIFNLAGSGFQPEIMGDRFVDLSGELLQFGRNKMYFRFLHTADHHNRLGFRLRVQVIPVTGRYTQTRINRVFFFWRFHRKNRILRTSRFIVLRRIARRNIPRSLSFCHCTSSGVKSYTRYSSPCMTSR